MIGIYENDNSGIGPVPAPGTKVPSHLRIWHHQHRSLSKYLSGEHLHRLGARIIENLSAELARVNPHDPVDSGDWVAVPDFYHWWTRRMLAAALSGLCGPHLVGLNEGFVEDFWEYMSYWPTLSKFYPHALAPRAYRARRRVLDAIKRWHIHAHAHSDCRDEDLNGDGWDEYWGSTAFKVMHKWGLDTNQMDDDALASEGLLVITA